MVIHLLKFFMLFSFLYLTLEVEAQDIEWVDGNYHDFKILKQHKETFYKFHFKNISKDTISIETIRTSCGCAAPSWTSNPIAPDSSSFIELEYNTAKLGYFERKIKVFFHQIRKAEVITIEGEVVE